MKLELILLELLERRDPDLVREVPLRNEAELEGGKSVALAAMKSALRTMEQRGELVCVVSEDTGTGWGVTDKGKARLARARN